MINILMSRSSAILEDYAIDEMKKILDSKMKVLVIGFSFFGYLNEQQYINYYGKDSEYYLKIEENFKTFGITNVNWIFYYGMNHDEMVKLIKEADVLYFPGGAPDLMYDRILEKDILKPLKDFNKIVIGSSAGAMIQLEKYHISVDNEYSKFSIHEGLGYINNFFIEVHYNRRKKQKSSMRKMRKNYKLDIFTIPDDGMIIVNNGVVKTLGNAKWMYNKKGIIKK